jgi:hypothetical protein
LCVRRVNRWRDVMILLVGTECEQMEGCNDTAFVY